MSEVNPPLYLDQDDAYGADELGLPYGDLIGEGVVRADDLKVTAGSSLQSSVAAGAAWVTGDDDIEAQPTYRVRNNAAVLLQHDAADATNPRIDLVIAEVLDATFSGTSKLWRLRVVKGTASGTPAAPALPSNAIALAQVAIPAGATTLGTITDERPRATVGGGKAPTATTTIPGELKIWPGSTLPASATYGTWVWADGGAYAEATYPAAAANIDSAWKTHNGKADPGTGQFRVPDMRGAIPVGLDVMPLGGGAANRTARANAMGAAFGSEYHTLDIAEMPAHTHNIEGGGGSGSVVNTSASGGGATVPTDSTGGGGAHENMPPANAVAYIVFLG